MVRLYPAKLFNLDLTKFIITLIQLFFYILNFYIEQKEHHSCKRFKTARLKDSSYIFLIATRNDRLIAVLRNLDDDAYVKTRISQYEALKNNKGDMCS